ncbi:hypothetical protein J6590_038954 [Homalodisca vitripennis]|nr:hypothetical protein J6590_038954 [Homalodisca vitripennis]
MNRYLKLTARGVSSSHVVLWRVQYTITVYLKSDYSGITRCFIGTPELVNLEGIKSLPSHHLNMESEDPTDSSAQVYLRFGPPHYSLIHHRKSEHRATQSQQQWLQWLDFKWIPGNVFCRIATVLLKAKGEVIVQFMAEIRKTSPPDFMPDFSKGKKVAMAGTSLRDPLPEQQPLAQVLRFLV